VEERVTLLAMLDVCRGALVEGGGIEGEGEGRGCAGAGRDACWIGGGSDGSVASCMSAEDVMPSAAKAASMRSSRVVRS